MADPLDFTSGRCIREALDVENLKIFSVGNKRDTTPTLSGRGIAYRINLDAAIRAIIAVVGQTLPMTAWWPSSRANWIGMAE